MFKKIFAILAIGLLIFSGIRAPETHEALRGICWVGTTLEKAVQSESRTFEFQKAASNPVILNAGFAPSLHPFDFPVTANIFDLSIIDYSKISGHFSFENHILLPHDRPPILSAF